MHISVPIWLSKLLGATSDHFGWLKQLRKTNWDWDTSSLSLVSAVMLDVIFITHAKCKKLCFVYVLMEICIQLSERLGPYLLIFFVSDFSKPITWVVFLILLSHAESRGQSCVSGRLLFLCWAKQILKSLHM